MSIEIKNLSFSYGNQSVLENISFSIEYGEFLSVLGPNGVGKSTLFRCMLGLLVPSAGSISIDGRSISRMSAAKLAQQIAYIPQAHNPVFNFRVSDMVLMGTTAHLHRFESPGKKQQHQALDALERLGIAHLKDRDYHVLSGGERQLVLIARAIAQGSRILIMDEPSANLDFGNRIHVMENIQNLTNDGYAVIQSTHDPDQAYRYSHRILALQHGHVLAFGTPQEIVTDSCISTLYNTNVSVHSLQEDRIRICIHDKSVQDISNI